MDFIFVHVCSFISRVVILIRSYLTAQNARILRFFPWESGRRTHSLRAFKLGTSTPSWAFSRHSYISSVLKLVTSFTCYSLLSVFVGLLRVVLKFHQAIVRIVFTNKNLSYRTSVRSRAFVSMSRLRCYE